MGKSILGRTTLVLFVIVAAASAAVAQSSPVITSISKISIEQYQTIVIKGSGFGHLAPYTGDSNYISLLDETKGWQAGYAPYGDTVTLIVNKWEDSKIILGGFSGAWGTYNYTLDKGDMEQVEVWNAQTGDGPATVYVTIAGEATRTTLSSSPNPSTFGQPVTFTAVVSSNDEPPPDGETVTFMQGTMTLGTGTLSGGTATFMTSRLKTGNHAITAVYKGDASFDGSKSNVVKQVVN